MPRWRRNLLLVVVTLVGGLPLLLVGTLRGLRDHAGGVFEVRPGVYGVDNLFSYVYAARAAPDRLLVFDGGIDPSGRALDALLGGLHATRDAVTDVFLTHGHFDHVQAAPVCKRARVYCGARDREMLEQLTPPRPALPALLAHVLPPPAIAASDYMKGRIELPIADGRTLVAVPLPGHTPGSYLLLYDGVLFAGDSLQISRGTLDFADPGFSVDMAANRAGVARLGRDLLDLRIDQVCTGHQGCIGNGRQLIDALVAKARQP